MLAAVPKCPPLARHVWAYFADLHATRGGTGFGPAPLSRVEIQAWERDECIRLAPWERRAILRIDAAFLAAHAKAQAPQETKQTEAPSGPQEVA